MEEKALILLLQIIKNNESIQGLIRYGLEYYQISEYINFALKEKYVIIKVDKVVITEKGLDKIKTSIRNDGDEWIRPLYEKRVKKLNKYDIYIPIK